MEFIAQIGSRLRAALLMILLSGVVILDSFSRIISMCVDGFLVLLIVALIWPLIRTKEESPEKK